MLVVEHCQCSASRACNAFQRDTFLNRKALRFHRAASWPPQRQVQRHACVPRVSCAKEKSASSGRPLCLHQTFERAPCTTSVVSACLQASSQLKASTLAAAALLPLLQQRWASAETLEAADASSVPPTDYLITGIFSVVILALAIVTIGVAYLSLSSFLDKRAEEEDKKKFEEAQRDRDLQALGVKRPKRKRSEDELTRGGGKGFGS